MRVIVTDSVSLQRVLWLKRQTEVAFALPNLAADKVRNLEARFNGLLSDSGSRFSALFLFAAASGCVLFDLGRHSVFAAHPVSVLSVNLFLCVFAIFSGKVFGLLRARWQLARLIWATVELVDDYQAAAIVARAVRRRRYSMNAQQVSA